MQTIIHRNGKPDAPSKGTRAVSVQSTRSKLKFAVVISTVGGHGTATLGWEDGTRATITDDSYLTLRRWMGRSKLFADIQINAGRGYPDTAPV